MDLLSRFRNFPLHSVVAGVQGWGWENFYRGRTFGKAMGAAAAWRSDHGDDRAPSHCLGTGLAPIHTKEPAGNPASRAHRSAAVHEWGGYFRAAMGWHDHRAT